MRVEIYLIRHGLTSSNEQHRYLGSRTDEELSDKGVHEVLSKRKKMIYEDNISSDFWFYGPMRRCTQTFEILFGDLTNDCNLQKISIPEWKEIDFGKFEQKNYIELSKDEEYQNWIDSGGTLPFPDGEDRGSFIERSYDGFVRMVDYIRKFSCIEDDTNKEHRNDRNIVRAMAVLHGGNIMSIMYKLLGGDYYDYQVKNLGGYRIMADVSDQIKIIEVEKLK